MQDGEKAEDVQFCTEETGITAGDREPISTLKFHMHPIEDTTDQWQALATLVECCKASFDARGVCCRPIMIFWSSQTFTDFLVELLKEAGAALTFVGKVDLILDRVRGIWAQCNDLKDWYERFREEPNVYAAQCDVIVCTTAIGADFSINSHLITSTPYPVRREATVARGDWCRPIKLSI
jgi:hypothetical protein